MDNSSKQLLRVLRSRLKDLLTNVEQKLANLERPLGAKAPEIIVRECPPEDSHNLRSSDDIKRGRGPTVRTVKGADCPNASDGPSSLATPDPMLFLRSASRKIQKNKRNKLKFFAGLATKTKCTDFKDKKSCEHDTHSFFFGEKCTWDKDRCGPYKK